MHRLSRTRMKQLRALKTAKGRRETGLFLVEGMRACDTALRAGCEVDCVLVSDAAAQDSQTQALLAGLTQPGPQVLGCTEGQLQSVADVTTAQGLVLVARWRRRHVEDLLSAPPPLVVALDRVGDPGNVGTILRAADWFGVGGVVLGHGCADLLNPKTVRASAGSLFHVPVWRNVDLPVLLPRLREAGHRVVATGTDGEPVRPGWAACPTTLVLGSEGHGLSPELDGLADARLAVPGRGRAESLNVAMAAVAALALATWGPAP